MLEITARALEHGASAPLGKVLTIPPNGGRTYVERALRPDGGTDTARLQAIVARGDQGVTFAAHVRHRACPVLDTPGSFAIMLCRNATGTDEELVDLAEPMLLR